MIDDRQLVEACLQGRIEAFTCLVDRYRYPVFGICLAYTKDFDAAEDAAQEAFVASYLKLRNLPDPDHFGPWLKRIAINQCKMWNRQQRRRVPLEEVDEKDLPVSTASPEDQIMSQETRQQVLSAIGQLNETQRQVVTLFYLEEIPLKQIAAFLDLPLQTVNQRLYRARLRLKEEMLKMVKKTLGTHKLPDGFTEQVMRAALERGRKALQEENWTSAQQEFGQIVDVLPDHMDARRGLALALSGEVREELREEGLYENEEVLQKTFNALRKAYELGADDDEIVRSRSRLYSYYGRYREGGQFLEQAAGKRSDWKESIPLLKSAIALYYHAYYKDGQADMEACVRCHRRIIEWVPEDWNPRRRLDIWQPAGVTLAYAHLGLSEEVFQQLDALKEEIGDTWSVQDCFQITCVYSNECVGKYGCINYL